MTQLKFPALTLTGERMSCVFRRDRHLHFTVFNDESRKAAATPSKQYETHDFQENYILHISPKEFSWWCLTLWRNSRLQFMAVLVLLWCHVHSQIWAYSCYFCKHLFVLHFVEVRMTNNMFEGTVWHWCDTVCMMPFCWCHILSNFMSYQVKLPVTRVGIHGAGE